jgi:hypothetical protein
METRPTKSEIGKTQKMVKALQESVSSLGLVRNKKTIPDAEADNPILDKLVSRTQIRRCHKTNIKD